jgi:immune inhibitor A
MSSHSFWTDLQTIYRAARDSEDGQRCAVAPHPELRAKMVETLRSIRSTPGFNQTFTVKLAEPKAFGLNDGMIYPPEEFPVGTAPSVIRSAAADRAPLRGALKVIVVLVDFTDKPMNATAAHFKDLFFSQGVIPTKSVREYYQEVTNGLIDIQGEVVGPFRMPQTLADYAHGGSGLGNALPNAQTMARDAVVASDPTVNFGPYDNNGDGFVDAFIVIHAGPGGEVTGNPGDIWSHKWVLDGGAKSVDGTRIFGYLTVPEDCKIGVCAHELGHLLFGFPDLYDTDGSSEGIGNWCLMAAGSWGGGGDTPAHPSAWCKVNQGWVGVDNRTTNGVVSIHDVKDAQTVYRLWKDGAPGNEYFLVENRQQSGFDTSLPGGGLLIWHIDEAQAGNTDENHYKVALMQADGKRDMEVNHSRGDAGDCYPGSSGNTTFNNTSKPNSKSYAGANSCVAVTGMSASGATMTANLQVRCMVKPKDHKPHKDKDAEAGAGGAKPKDFKEIEKKEHKDFKEKEIEKKEHKEIKEPKEFKDHKDKDHKDKEKEKDKDFKDIKDKEHKDKDKDKEKDKDKDFKDFKEIEKPIFDKTDKPITDKSGAFDKGPADKVNEGKLGEGPGGPGGGFVAGRSAGGPQAKSKDSLDKLEKESVKDFKDKDFKDKDHKDFKDKDFKDVKEKEGKDNKDKEKETTDKPFKDFKEFKDHKDKDGKDKEHKELESPPQHTSQMTHLDARLAALEAALRGGGTGAAQPFIGRDLRPDLSQTPFKAEDDQGNVQEQMKKGSASAKRAYDTKPQG